MAPSLINGGYAGALFAEERQSAGGAIWSLSLGGGWGLRVRSHEEGLGSARLCIV